MKRIYKIFAIAVAVIMSACATYEENGNTVGGGDTPGVPIVNSPEGAQGGEILIKFRPEISDLLDQAQTRSGSPAGVLRNTGINTVDELMEVIGGYRLERVFPFDNRREDVSRKTGLHLWYVVYFDEDMDVEKVAGELSQLGELAKIQYSHEIKRNYTGRPTPLSEVALQRPALTRADASFNDPELPLQWGYINKGNGLFENMLAGADINCAEAWNLCAGDPSVVVAVMDEGVMWSHPDLVGNIWINENEVYKSGVDNDDNGYKGDCYGYNFVNDTGVISWDHLSDTGHGTHIAGTIAAVNNNGVGVCGIAGGSGNGDGVKIMSLQVFAGNKGVTTVNNVRAIKYAADNGAVILQCSWGYISALANPLNWGSSGYYDDDEYIAAQPLEREAFEYFIYNAGSPSGVIDGGLVIFASGNEEAAMAAYPGAYKEFICVSALGADYTPSTYTNYGPGVDISAPGGDANYHASGEGSILSTLPPLGANGDYYGYMDGTSMACPHVAGTAALGLSYAAKLHKHFNSRQFRDLILKSARDIDPYLSTSKTFYTNWTYAGKIHPSQMDLKPYKGKMGSGMIDAALLLRNVENGGTAITLSNVYVTVGGRQTIDVMRCFDGGETATFTASSADTSVASVAVEGSKVTITGVAVGSTTFSVTSSSGGTQTAHITARKTANDNGWL